MAITFTIAHLKIFFKGAVQGPPWKSWDFVQPWGRVYDPMPNSILKSMAFKTTKRQNASDFLYFSIVSMCTKSYRCHLCGSSASGRATWVLNFRNWKPSGLQHLLQNAPCLPKLCENHRMGIRLPIQIVEASAQHLLLYWEGQIFVPLFVCDDFALRLGVQLRLDIVAGGRVYDLGWLNVSLCLATLRHSPGGYDWPPLVHKRYVSQSRGAPTDLSDV